MRRQKRSLVGAVVLGLVGIATGGCVSSDAGQSESAEGCNITLRYDGHRYEVHSDLANPPVSQQLGTADEVGCESDATVYGEVNIFAVQGVSPEIAIAVVSGQDDRGRVDTYLRDDQPRDRAPTSWPVSLAPGAFE